MAEQIIEGRVIQKIATVAEWSASTLPLKKGEFAIVSDSTGKPINIRVGNGTLPFTGLVDMFDNIQQNVNFIKYNGGSALPTPTIDTGYTFVSEGSYTFGGSPAFTVPAGHWGTANWDGNSWSFTDLGELPQVDVSNKLDRGGYSGTAADLTPTATISSGQAKAISGDTANKEFNLISRASVNLVDKSNISTTKSYSFSNGQIVPVQNNLNSIFVGGLKPNTTYSVVGINVIFVGNLYNDQVDPNNDATFNSSTRVQTLGTNTGVKTQFEFNTGADGVNLGLHVGSSQYFNTVMLYEGSLSSIPAYESFGRVLRFDTLPDYQKIVTTDQINPTQVNTSINNINQEISNIQDSLYTNEEVTIGLPSPNAGNNSTSTARTRIDNRYPVNVDGAVTVKINTVRVYANVAGSGKIKFVQKTTTEGRYNISNEFNVTFVVGLNVFSTETFGANLQVPNNTYLAFYSASPAAISVSVDATGASYMYTSSGGDLTSATTSSINSGLIQFNVDYESSVNAIPFLVDQVGALETSGVQYPNMMYKFEPNGNGTGQGKFTVYAKLDGNKYIAHVIARTIDNSDAVYLDYYRYMGSTLVVYSDGVFTGNTIVFTSQESEFVWQQSGKSDFTGGFHGDERLTDVRFYVDNQIIANGNTTDAIALTTCDSFYYIEKSTMHEAPTGGAPNPAHPVQANHTKITSIDRYGYKSKNLCNWTASIILAQYYSGICCVSRNLSTTGWSNKDYVEYNLDTDSAQLGGRGYREYSARNASTGLSVFFTSRVIDGGTVLVDSQQVLDVRDNGLPAQYKKGYRGFSTNTPLGSETKTTVVGETWISEMECRFEIK